MGNHVSHGVRQDLPGLSMSNGLTSVFIGILSIATSAFAQSESEKRMAVWIASHDQSVFGSGAVGFDVCDFPWAPDTFESDKRFLLEAIDAAAGKFEWHKLGYSPREDFARQSLNTFRELVEHFLAEHVLPMAAWKWHLGEEPAKFERCAKHGVYVHAHGCVLCNDV